MKHMKRIEEEVEDIWVHVEKIEPGRNNLVRITLKSVYGEQAIELEESIARKLWPGDMLVAHYTHHYSPFIILSNQDSSEDDIYTIRSVLESLRIPSGEYIYHKSRPKNP